MTKKIRRMRTFARTASKSMEKQLIDNAKELKKDPFIILPDYEDKYSEIVFKKIKKGLEKVNRFKDDTKKLEKLSKKRNFSGAMAGTLLIAHSEKAPYLAVAEFTTGDITYAQRGKADKEQLISVQHFDDPVLRLLGIKNIALKTKMHIYSWDEGFFSAGREAKPPEKFIDFIIKKTDLNYNKNIATCGHIKPEEAKNKEISTEHYLHIYWESAGIIFSICESCAKSKKNTIFNITKYMVEPKISEDFQVNVIGQLVKGKKSESDQKTQFVDKYLSGELTDYEFIKNNKEHREESIKESGEKILILDGVSYSNDTDQFIKVLKPNKFEKEGLEIILNKIEEPVILNNATPNKVLEKFWKDHGLNTINSIIKDKEMAEKFFALEDTPSEILELVFNYKERQKILSELPRYKSLPPLAEFIDNVARTYKTFGEKKTLLELKKAPDNPKGKSISYAFLLVFQKGEDKKWKYSPVEIEYGEFLKSYAQKLLDCKPEQYHNALQDLLIASGSSENIESNRL